MIRAWMPWRRRDPQPRRLMLTGTDFKVLISGGVVERDGVSVALHDIGYGVMAGMVYQASKGTRGPGT